MGWAVLYIAFGLVALWLLGEVLLQYKARLRWRLVAFFGFLGVVAGVVLPSVPLIAVGAVAFAVGQTFVTLSFRRGFSTGWALGGRPGTSRRRRAETGGVQPLAPVPEDAEDPAGAGGAGQAADAWGAGAAVPPQPGRPPVDGGFADAEGDYPTGRLDPFAAEAAQRSESSQGEEIYGASPTGVGPEAADSYQDPYQALYADAERGGYEQSHAAGEYAAAEAGGEGYGYDAYSAGYPGGYGEGRAGQYPDRYPDEYPDYGSGTYQPDVPPEHQAQAEASVPGGYPESHGAGPDFGAQPGGYPQGPGTGEWSAPSYYQDTPPGGVWMPQQRDPSRTQVPGGPNAGLPGEQAPYAPQEGYEPGQGYYYGNDQRY